MAFFGATISFWPIDTLNVLRSSAPAAEVRR